MVSELGEAARAINGCLADSCRGWFAHVEELQRQIEKESMETVAKLLNRPMREINATVDEKHIAKVIEARKTT